MHRSGRYASLLEGLVGAWCPSVSGSFGQSVPDLSLRGNTGALWNMDPPTDWVINGGKMALDFDGVNDYVKVEPSSTFATTGGANWTLSAWVYSTNMSLTTQTIFNRQKLNTSPRDYIFYAGNNTFQLQNSNGTSYPTISTSAIYQNNIWYHVVGSCNVNGNANIYVNGVSQASGTLRTDVAADNSRNVIIGTTFDGVGEQYRWLGALDDLRIYNRQITPSEIQLLYTGGRGVGLMPERRRWFYSAVASLIDGSSASAITTIGSLGGSGALSGSASLAFTTAAAVAGAGLCAGSSSLQFEASGAIGGGSALTATTDLVIATTAAISGGQVISGTAALTFGSSGSTSGIGALDGSLAISIATDATIFATAAVSGSAALAVGISATLGGSALLSGSVALASSATATPAGIEYASDAAWPSSIRATTWRQVRRSNLTTWAAKER